jgi:hypothetical protein
MSMLEIDGAQQSGSGTIVRCAVASLAIATGLPITGRRVLQTSCGTIGAPGVDAGV